jgi:hypothetical protein
VEVPASAAAVTLRVFPPRAAAARFLVHPAGAGAGAPASRPIRPGGVRVVCRADGGDVPGAAEWEPLPAAAAATSAAEAAMAAAGGRVVRWRPEGGTLQPAAHYSVYVDLVRARLWGGAWLCSPKGISIRGMVTSNGVIFALGGAVLSFQGSISLLLFLSPSFSLCLPLSQRHVQ